MKKYSWPVLFGILGLLTAAVCRADGPYHFIKEIPIGGEGGWDYLSVDPAAQRLYVSHGTEVVVIDLAKDQVCRRNHQHPGRARRGRGAGPRPAAFTSNGRENKAGIVDLKTLQTLSKVDTGARPGRDAL